MIQYKLEIEAKDGKATSYLQSCDRQYDPCFFHVTISPFNKIL